MASQRTQPGELEERSNPSEDPGNVIEIRDLTRIYRVGDSEVRALDGISLSVPYGQFLAVMGPSGSGKSTLMNIVGCLDRPTSGTYVLEGRDVSRLDRDARAEIRNEKIGFVFQMFNLLARTSALENVELPLLYSSKSNLSDAQREAKARQCLERVGLADRWDHTSTQLSGGQQQRVAIARSLVNDPAILLADEPTGNLDSKTSEEVLAIFQGLNDEGKTIVLITHEPDIARCAQRIITFRDGQLLSDRWVEDRLRVEGRAPGGGSPLSGREPLPVSEQVGAGTPTSKVPAGAETAAPTASVTTEAWR
jgi:putative ABC transport system ATP-binding protein